MIIALSQLPHMYDAELPLVSLLLADQELLPRLDSDLAGGRG